MLNLLARRYACDFTGIDTSNSAIADASKRNREFVSDGRIRLLCENASAMSFPDSSFCKAYTVNTVYFWKNLDETMTEVWRVLKPSGLFINTLYRSVSLL